MPSFEPCARLKNCVERFEIVHPSRAALMVLPSAVTVLGFQFRGRVRAEQGLLSPAGVTGIQQVARRYQYIDEAGSVLVRFTAQGAACLGVPGALLSNVSLALEDLLPASRVREVLERLQEAADDRERILALEEFLLALSFRRDPLVTQALAFLDGSTEEPRIESLARSLSVSERQLERRFLHQVGVTPKRFARLRRFERAVELAPSSESLTRAALAAGYYDQSHFVRDFRGFTGMAPGEYLRSSG
jgi:AraC-like DNA-binding protein